MNKSIFRLPTILFTMLVISLPASAADGMINVKSQFDVKTTANKFKKILNKKEITIFKIINHSENGAKAGVKLRETQLIIFGDPKGGSPLIKCQPSIGIDLPLKALIWKDHNNDVWISYNDMLYLKNRHHVKGCDKIILKISKLLKNITSLATKK